jgi:hypothetical protein
MTAERGLLTRAERETIRWNDVPDIPGISVSAHIPNLSRYEVVCERMSRNL